MTDLVRVMQAAASESEAEPSSSRLESAFFPNQALQPGCAEMAAAVFRGLASATPAGAVESWGVLGQVAAGACREAARDDKTLDDVRGVFTGNADLAIARLVDAEAEPYDLLVVDVVDAMLMFADPGLRDACLHALRVFQRRGPGEADGIEVILRDYPDR